MTTGSSSAGDVPVLRLTAIKKEYTRGALQIPVLRGIDLDVKAGEYIAILGPSGAGKSTLLHVLGLLTRPTSGRYLLDGADTELLPPRGLANLRCRKLGFVFQDYQLIDWCSSLYNVTLPLIASSTPRKEREGRGREWLERLGLGHRLQHRSGELSGGEQQRVAIARALIAEPKVLLADEATGNLDQERGDEILDLFDEFNAQGRIIIHVTHSRAVAGRARRTLRLVDGGFAS